MLIPDFADRDLAKDKISKASPQPDILAVEVIVLADNSRCPHEICRVGLWYVVRSGCNGEIRLDAVNGDKKVWFLDCEDCSTRAGSASGAGGEGGEALKNQRVPTLPEWF